MKRIGSSASVLTLILTIGTVHPAAADTAASCSSLAGLTIPHTQVTSAELLPGGDDLPEHCLVVGVVNTMVGFEVRLPTDWVGKLYFAGNFLFAGSFADISLGLVRGYATASTDTGHQADIFDASWALDNRAAEVDYAHRAVHLTTVVAKAIVAAYYGEGPRFSYFDGCSNGGRQGLREAEQYPRDFDGIAAGAPALDFTGAVTAVNWNMQALHATPDSSDLPLEKLPVIEGAVLASCDALDGLVDGLVDDPRRCAFDPDTLRCPGGDAPDCLTPEQVESLKKIYAGPTNSEDERLYPGLSVGGETLNLFGWDAWLINTVDGPSPGFVAQDQALRYLSFRIDDPNFDWATFDFDADPQRMRFMANLLNASETDLSEFRAHGGKLLLYHGWSDPLLAPVRTIDFYEGLRHRLGQRTPSVARLFMAPGVSHCFGGTGPGDFDYLAALEDWVERGTAPDSIVASHFDGDGNVDRTRPLCAYPRVARYQGSGSIDDASNFECVEPPSDPDDD